MFTLPNDIVVELGASEMSVLETRNKLVSTAEEFTPEGFEISGIVFHPMRSETTVEKAYDGVILNEYTKFDLSCVVTYSVKVRTKAKLFQSTHTPVEGIELIVGDYWLNPATCIWKEWDGENWSTIFPHSVKGRHL